MLGSNCEERVPLGVQDLLAAAQGAEDSFHAQDFGAVDGLDVEVIAGQREDFLFEHDGCGLLGVELGEYAEGVGIGLEVDGYGCRYEDSNLRGDNEGCMVFIKVVES